MGARRRFVFVDRDGTLIEDPGYVFRVEDYTPLDRAAAGLRLLAEAGFGIAIVTNQSGIGRGLYGEDDFQRFQRHLVDDFAAHGAPIEATFFCPHHPDEGCACRKPETGLLLRAAEELGCVLSECWMIGDKPSDVEAGRRAGCRSVYVLTGDGATLRDRVPADVTIEPDLIAAARTILRLS